MLWLARIVLADKHQHLPWCSRSYKLPYGHNQICISHELRLVTQRLATISQANKAIRGGLHDVSSLLANLPPPEDQNSP